ncbi:PemK-like, MazF-like toxin of type II toxin-antitoxin system [Murinocardiopsis flavida]|uniref:PemK-like, MazF-like toxin of type II toxin-antitoxin system n=1 Tax=Murinocardiopsis flavida TaxID=645275 RepID=A0A2P8DGC0_9ACTN|nr:type II toxin-antitoxin system PemK/MazF family toxin [Murinocardiopsis flavida]PSK96265.1 PemK-like, MazF-like toxin of type II toxin-antitoxin system [Murinocardiopsis flavida]
MHNSAKDGRADHPHRGEVREVPTARNATSLEYSPDRDGRADAGEIVWTWVPYEEDPQRGKDRPLLVVGRRGTELHALMLSSQEPDTWEEHDWFDLGAWDDSGRPSHVRLDRLFQLGESDIRREGAILDGRRFAEVAAVLRERYGWH